MEQNKKVANRSGLLQTTTSKTSDSYLNNDGTLKDDAVLTDIYKAAAMYENGELIETHDILLNIVHAIDDFSN